MSFRFTVVAAAAMFASVQAHIIMEQPVPYSVDKVDSGPITASQFPCKSQNGFTVSSMNNMAVGSQQTIKFKGTAVHGGGSCQLSVTMDTEPTVNSVFKVIKSIEGGCPGVEGKTNEYNFELPDSIPNGKATFAWTWFSKMSGAPELYMNCAPIEVTGGANDDSAFQQLPDMFVANIGKGCTTAQNFATKFPNAGQAVEMGNTGDQEAPNGLCGTTDSTPSGPSEPSEPSEPSGPASAAPSAAPTSPNNGQYTPIGQPSTAPTPSAAVPSNPGGVFAPGASSAAPVEPSAAPVQPTAAPVPTQTSTTLITVTGRPTGTGSPAQPTAPSSPSAGGGSGTCTENGAIVCNGESQFGLCNNGNVVWQAVAAGTTCSNGAITKRGYNGRIPRPRYSSPRVGRARI